MAHVANTVTIRSPISPVPFEGKDTIADVLTLLDTLDAFAASTDLNGKTDGKA